MHKPNRRTARPLGELVESTLADAFARQGFAAMRIVTHWADIVGADIAAHAEPLRINWPRQADDDDAQSATLVLRVEGPVAVEIQHQSAVIIERVNRFFGFAAIGRIALRQAPLTRRASAPRADAVDPEAARRIAEGLPGITDADLRAALGRLGAAVKRS
ncbi:MAG: DUF721 domain-containing protein [Proteobacteria bacterium]|nr:DUF721 domain-containing protein [Pseudomonadota bacterium]